MPRHAAATPPPPPTIDDAFASVGLLAPQGFGGLLRDALRLVVAEPPIADPTSELTETELTELRAAGLRTVVPADAYTQAVSRTDGADGRDPRGRGHRGGDREDAWASAARACGSCSASGRCSACGPRTAGWCRGSSSTGTRRCRGCGRSWRHCPPGLHPVAFHTWFTTPTGALRLDDAAGQPA